MGSIPLAANNLKVPEQPNALEQYSRLVQLQQQQKLLPGQLQQQQQTLQAGQQENQQREMDMNSQKALMRAYEEAGGNLDKAVPLAAKYGAKPDAVIKLREASMNQQKQNIELLNAKGARAIQEADLMQGAHDAVAAAKPEDRPGLYQQQLAGLQQAGVDISQAPPQYPGDEQFKVFGIGIKGHKQQLEDLFKQSEAREKNAQAAKLEQETKYTSGPAAEGRYRFVLAKLAAKQPVPQEDLDFARGFEASNAKTTSQSDSLGVTSVNTARPSGLSMVGGKLSAAPANGGAPSGGGTPSSGNGVKDSIVDAIGQYKYNPMLLNRMAVKHPDILAAVTQKYPDFSQPNYNAINKLMTNYTSGPQSKEINAINTAMGHIKNLDDAIDALHNGNMTALNNIGKVYNMNFAGKTPEAAFQLIVHRVGPEIASAYIPGGGGQGERMADEKDFDVNLPPQTLHNNASITVNMLRSKIGALENQYKNTVGRDDFSKKFITPEAQASLQKMAPQGGGGSKPSLSVGQKVTLKSGKTVTIKAVHPDGTFDAE